MQHDLPSQLRPLNCQDSIKCSRVARATVFASSHHQDHINTAVTSSLATTYLSAGQARDKSAEGTFHWLFELPILKT